MDIKPIQVPKKLNQQAQNSTQKERAEEGRFGKLFKETVETVSYQAVIAAEETEKQRLRKEKAKLEALRKKGDDDDEPVQNIKDKIHALAELERRARGLGL
ncbi:MAG: hypothetical protein EXS67_04215 [Candidatus Margulisbacteria bacterium]|nr:hypothetical protein [Candidatus Margulisiibacteriota bacterium]